MYHHTVSETPFLDRARVIARTKEFVAMDAESDRARSHAWWKRLVTYGAWGQGWTGGRVGPPDREALDGIAKLFGTTPERVAEMVAADWYGVNTEVEVSARVLNLSHILDSLSEDDAKLVESLARRLAEDRGKVLDSEEHPEPTASVP
jgi:hypothetical protein